MGGVTHTDVLYIRPPALEICESDWSQKFVVTASRHWPCRRCIFVDTLALGAEIPFEATIGTCFLHLLEHCGADVEVSLGTVDPRHDKADMA